MAAPTITSVYPADADTGLPIGIAIKIDFSSGIDLANAKKYVVLYGADYDRTSGPDSAVWLNHETGENPFFLSSPGFKGLVDANYELVYLNEDGDEIATPTLASASAESVAGYTHRLKVTPKQGQLAASTEYKLHIMGDPDSEGAGITKRIVWDVVPNGANSGTTGSLTVHSDGAYASADDTINVQITTSGDISTAKYKWWLSSLGSGSAVTGRVTSRKFRTLSDTLGLEIRFTGSGFVNGDTYTVALSGVERLATNTQVTFTTGDGSYVAAPDSPSTPAPSVPPSSAYPGVTTAEAFEPLDVFPPDRSYNVDLANRTITIEFDSDLDAATVTQESVTVTVYPVLGEYAGRSRRILAKKLTVSGNILTIEY